MSHDEKLPLAGGIPPRADTPLAAPAPRFTALLQCPQLQILVTNPIWTISDVNKRPLDVRTLFSDHPVGAKANDERAVTSIAALYKVLGGARLTNLATFWNYDLSSFMLLDVESHADKALIARMATLPAVYAEYSLSGRGMHLVMPMPKLPDGVAFPEVRHARVLHGDTDDWEIHLRHWVTFTGLSIPINTTVEGEALWLDMFTEAATRYVHRHAGMGPDGGTTVSSERLKRFEEHPPRFMDEVIASFSRPDNRPAKTQADFRYDKPHRGKGPFDMSRFEMSCLCHYAWILVKDMRNGRFCKEQRPHPDGRRDADDPIQVISRDQWGNEELAYILYEAARTGKAGFKHRAKHDEYRLGVPYLYYQAMGAVDFVQRSVDRTIERAIAKEPTP